MTVLVVCDGDSVVAGTGVTPWPNSVAADCNTIAAVTPTVTNKALSGQNSYQMLWGATGSPTAPGADGLTGEVLSLNPNVVMAQMSTLNDALALAAGTTTLTALRQVYRTYINTVLAKTAPNGSPTPIIVLCDNFCYQLLGTFPRPFAMQDAVHQTWLQVMAEYANNPFVTVVDPYAVFRRQGVDTAGLAGFLQADTVHPNASAYLVFNFLLQYPIANLVSVANGGAAYGVTVPNPAPLVPVSLKTSALLAALGEYAPDPGTYTALEIYAG